MLGYTVVACELTRMTLERKLQIVFYHLNSIAYGSLLLFEGHFIIDDSQVTLLTVDAQ